MVEPVIIGRATLYLGDCREILPTIAPVDLVCTDPPFVGVEGGIDLKSSKTGGSGVGRDSGTTVGDIWNANHEWLPLAWEKAIKGLMTFCTYHSVADIPTILETAPCGIVMWNKPNAPYPARNVPRAAAELIWLFRKEPGLNWRAIDKSVFDLNTLMTGCMADPERILAPGTKKALHPTQKPLKLMEWLLGVEPASVCDPFMGTGTTGVAALKRGVPFIGIERDPMFFEIACDRLSKVSGEDAGPLFGEAA